MGWILILVAGGLALGLIPLLMRLRRRRRDRSHVSAQWIADHHSNGLQGGPHP